MIWIDENNFVREDKKFFILKKWVISFSENAWWKWKILLKWYKRKKIDFKIDKKFVFDWINIVQNFDENDILRAYLYWYKKSDIQDIKNIFEDIWFENNIFFEKWVTVENFSKLDEVLYRLDNVDKVVSYLIWTSIFYWNLDENNWILNNINISIPLIWATWNYWNMLLEKINLLKYFSIDAKILPKKFWSNLNIFIDDEEILESFKNFYNKYNLYEISKVAKTEILSKLKSKFETITWEEIFFILKIFKNG